MVKNQNIWASRESCTHMGQDHEINRSIWHVSMYFICSCIFHMLVFFFFFYRSFICLLVMFMYMVACKLMIPLACMYHIAFMINPRVISKGIPVWFVVTWSCLIHVWSPKGFCVWFLLACYVLVDCERGSGLLNSCIYRGGEALT